MSQNHPILSGLWRIISSVMIVSFTDRDTRKGHLRSCEVISSLLPINHDTMVLKTYKWYQTARLVKTSRLTCNMTITPAPNWVMTRPRPEVKFKLSYEGHHAHVSNRLDKKNTMVLIPCLYLSFKSYIACNFQDILCLMTSADLNIDLTWFFFVKSCRYVTDLSNAVCRWSLRCLVFEIWRGPNPPPPTRIEPFRARPEPQ